MKSMQRALFAACMAVAGSLASAETPVVTASLGGFDYAVTPPVLNFYGAVGVASATQNVNIAGAGSNTGSVSFTGCSFSGPQAADFSMSPPPTFPMQVAAGATIIVPIRFFAGALGPRIANFSCQTANGTAVGGSFPVALNGMGVTNTLTTPSALVFPDTMQGSSSAPMNLIAAAGASNTGNVTITACSLGGAHPGDFAQFPAVVNLAVAPGASVFIPVIFAPAAAGARAATLTCSMTNGQTATFDVALSGTGTSPAQTTTRASVATGGGEGNEHSYSAPLSAEGRYVVFESWASNLVPGDTNDMPDIFVHDRQNNQTQRVSVSTAGVGGFGPSYDPVISADGRYVAFNSLVDTLVPGDTNGVGDVFVHDRQTGQTQRVSVTSSGGEALGSSDRCVLSADGRYVSFVSIAFNLVNDDSNGADDVFVHDRQTGLTQRVSVDNGGGQANAGASEPALSADGRFVAFTSFSSNLVSGDTNGMLDVFVHDRWLAQTQRVSLPMNGGQANGHSIRPSLSADGRFVAFESEASNLVPIDNNAANDVFVRDRRLGLTERTSVTTGDWEVGGDSWAPFISADGRHVAFTALINLIAEDTNDFTDVYVRDRGNDAINLLYRNGFE